PSQRITGEPDLAVVLPGAGEHIGEAASVDGHRLATRDRVGRCHVADTGPAHAARSRGDPMPRPATGPGAGASASTAPTRHGSRPRSATGRARNTTLMRGGTGRVVLGMPCS